MISITYHIAILVQTIIEIFMHTFQHISKYSDDQEKFSIVRYVLLSQIHSYTGNYDCDRTFFLLFAKYFTEFTK